MRILIVISDLGGGGAQRSLISFLQCLDRERLLRDCQIDLLVGNEEGILADQVPASVRVIGDMPNIVWMNCPLGTPVLKRHCSLASVLAKIKWILLQRWYPLRGKRVTIDTLWKSWKSFIPENPVEYDVAIAYLEGWPTYYVVDKVRARRKIAWVHNEYQQLPVDPIYDRGYFTQCDRVITISDKCVTSLEEIFPELSNRISLLQNISNVESILQKAKKGQAPEFESANEAIKILSIGRLNPQKNFALAIRAASLLQDAGLTFRWLILGEGPERPELETLIDSLGLNDYVELCGIKKNPYPYIQQCDVFVQSSRFEGKSIVIDEAKILAKPIVVTDYPTVNDTIIHETTGIIAHQDSESLASAILTLLDNSDLRKTLEKDLIADRPDNTEEVAHYIDAMFGKVM